MPDRLLGLVALGAITLALCLAAGGAGASGAAAADAPGPPLPPGLLGITPNTTVNDQDLDRMGVAGASTVRFGLPWASMQPVQGGPIDWTEADNFMARANRRGLAVDLVVSTTPTWARSSAAADRWEPPISSVGAKAAWTTFVRRAVARYGRDGTFWAAHPGLRYLPVAWTVWNEPNLIRFWDGGPAPAEFAHLMNLTGPVIRAQDPSARIIAGGVFCDYGWKGYIQRFYESVDKSSFDDFAIHPYRESPYASFRAMLEARQAMDRGGDPDAGIWVDEISWGTDETQERFVTSPREQAENIRILFQILAYRHEDLKLRRLLWYGFRDDPTALDCQFCGSSGLWLANGIIPKPGWFVFRGMGSGSAGSIRGAVYGRHSGKAAKPLAGQRLYLDLDDNGRLQPGEPQTKTADDGSYAFPNLFPTDYAVRVVPHDGQACEKPKGCERLVEVAGGQKVGEQRFVLRHARRPDTRITKAKVNSRKRKAKFKFKAFGADSPYGFRCKLDSKRYRKCHSPKTYRHLKPGTHTLRVRARDGAGRFDPTPAKRRFRVRR